MRRSYQPTLPGVLPVPKLSPRESEIQAAIMAYLRRRGIQAKRVPMGQGRFGSKSRHSAGLPDIVGVLPGGRFLAIEVKRPGVKLRKDQVVQHEWLDVIRKIGALVIVARSVEDVEWGLSGA